MAGSDDARRAWVERVLGLRLQPVSATDGAAMKLWQAERANAVANLRALANEIVKAGDPEARRAVILLQAIIKNLTPMPDSLQSVAELERYLTDDDIIVDADQPNPFGVDLKLRAALLPALAGLRQEYAATEG
jgi:hypothetical protein